MRCVCAGHCGAVSFPETFVGRGMSFHFVDPVPHVPFPVPFCASIRSWLHPMPIDAFFPYMRRC